MSDELVPPDPWTAWRRHTPARIALGRSGVSLPTAELLAFGAAHAAARDAIHTQLDVDALVAELGGWRCVAVTSQAAQDDATRQTYLRRPDLGRRLAEDSAQALTRLSHSAPDVAFVIGDGLSSLAVQRHAAPLLAALRDLLGDRYTLAPLVVATQARVALADEIGERLNATLSVMLIGERPGLSSPDSLGAYLTFAPKVGRTDADRNCVSNIRAAGLGYDEAAERLCWLIAAAFERRLSGVRLKDESGGPVLDAP